MAPKNGGGTGTGDDKAPNATTATTTTTTSAASTTAVADNKYADKVERTAVVASRKRSDANPPASKSPVKKKKQKTNKDVDDMAWICGECNEAEYMLDPAANFVLCDGTCFRVFHYPCVGMSQIPESDEDWLCKDCQGKRHQCAFCQEYGEDDVDVFRCRRVRCGLYFHESCLAMNNIEVSTMATTANSASEENKSDNGDAVAISEPPAVPVFTCPAHTCWTCTQKDLQKAEQEVEAEKASNVSGRKKKGKSKKKHQSVFQCKTETRLFRCLYCPWAYHASCIPPTSRFHELAVLCPEHSETHKLPELDLSTSFQGSVEDQIDQKMLKLSGKKKSRSHKRGGANPFFPGMRGDRLHSQEKYFLEYLANKNSDDNIVESAGDTSRQADNATIKESQMQQQLSKLRDLSFCLPCDVKNEIHSKPPSYRVTHSLRYDANNKPKKIPPTGERCHCVGRCGDDCFNRMLSIECYGDGGKNSNCNVVGTDDCGNRAIGKRQYVKCKPKREGGRGWGLVTLEAIPKGKLVLEYVGEVIDEKTKDQRLLEWNQEHPNDHNFYVMALSGGWYIDARECANMSRFINHSCDPNCMLATINVKGYKRNGIFSKRDIAAGEFLSYDYHFDTKQGDRFVCRCGSKKCRGTMKGKNGTAEAKKPTTWKEAKARYEQDKKFLEERKAQQVVSQVGAILPGAEQHDEYVMAGPPEKHRDSVVRNHIFLWRNASLGADFVSRNSRIESSGIKQLPKKVPPQMATTEKDVLSLVQKYHSGATDDEK